jgi:hypothetical protein
MFPRQVGVRRLPRPHPGVECGENPLRRQRIEGKRGRRRSNRAASRHHGVKAAFPYIYTRAGVKPWSGQNPSQGQFRHFLPRCNSMGTAVRGPLPIGSPGTLSPRSTFYPCRLEAGHHILYSPRGESGKCGARTPSHARTAKPPRDCSGPSHPLLRCLVRSPSALSGYAAFRTLFFRTAPAGGVPVCRYFHSSIRSFRASATIPIFRCRGLPRP